jgi:hypothetical protein
LLFTGIVTEIYEFTPPGVLVGDFLRGPHDCQAVPHGRCVVRCAATGLAATLDFGRGEAEYVRVGAVSGELHFNAPVWAISLTGKCFVYLQGRLKTRATGRTSRCYSGTFGASVSTCRASIRQMPPRRTPSPSSSPRTKHVSGRSRGVSTAFTPRERTPTG